MITSNPYEIIFNCKAAYNYLSNCGELTIEKYRAAIGLSGFDFPESQILGMWQDANNILPINNQPGGHESLKYQMKEMLNKRIEIEKQNLGKLNNDQKYFLAVLDNNETDVKQILNSGVDVNVRTSSDQTALMLVTLSNNSKLAKLLIDSGADIDLKDNGGHTVRDHAQLLGADKILNIIEISDKNVFQNEVDRLKKGLSYLESCKNIKKNNVHEFIKISGFNEPSKKEFSNTLMNFWDTIGTQNPIEFKSQIINITTNMINEIKSKM